MAGNIFLGGGGNAQQSSLLDDALLAQFEHSREPSCLYVPVAMAEERHESARKWFHDSFGDRFGLVRMISRFSELSDDFKFDIVFMGGGNTGRLLDRIYEAGFDDYLRSQLKEGRVVYGGSAGAVVLGSTILTAPAHELTTRNEGLSFLGGAAVLPHYNHEADHDVVGDKSVELGCTILAIPEDAGVIIDGNGGIQAVGKSDVYVCEPRRNLYALTQA